MCALTVRHLMKDERSVRACEVSLKFADGEATREELDAAAYAAAAYAANAAAADAAARIKSQQQTADICREHLTSAVFEKLNLL